MKIFQTQAKAAATAVARPQSADVQAKPHAIRVGNAIGQLKVDVMHRTGNLLLVGGWCTAAVQIGLTSKGRSIGSSRFPMTREDVARHFSLSPGLGLGFLLVAESGEDELRDLQLTWSADGTIGSSGPLVFDASAPAVAAQSWLHQGLQAATGQVRRYSAAWKDLVKLLPAVEQALDAAKGHIEGAAACMQMGDAVVFGWALHDGSVPMWLESEKGLVIPLDDTFRYLRPDLATPAFTVTFGSSAQTAGFVVHVRGAVPGETVYLKALTDRGVGTVHGITCAHLPAEPTAAACWLFGVGAAMPVSLLPKRIARVDSGFLEPRIQQRDRAWSTLCPTARQYGEVREYPRVSVVVSIAGRLDLFEHHLIEFGRDPWLVEHAQIICAVDDPALAASIDSEAVRLFDLYQIPFLCVAGCAGGGPAMAANIGARHAVAPLMCFVRGDVIPQHAGWLEALCEVITGDEQLGAVAPRLVSVEGSIHHAGLTAAARHSIPDFKIERRLFGLDPSLDRSPAVQRVPAVSPACVVTRKADFERVGGFCTAGVLQQNDELDLSMGLAAHGLDSAYVSTVQLTCLDLHGAHPADPARRFELQADAYNALRRAARWSRESAISA